MQSWWIRMSETTDFTLPITDVVQFWIFFSRDRRLCEWPGLSGHTRRRA